MSLPPKSLTRSHTGLQDVSGYVRKTAVMCVLRLRELSEEVVRERRLVHEIFHLLNDRDPQVLYSRR